jgi:starch synthase (maltosyl-transferring)
MMEITDGRIRVIIEGVRPEIDGGRFPIKRAVGEKMVVEADIFTDSHDALSCVLLYRKEDESQWKEHRMEFLVNDRWRGEFNVTELGHYRYTVQAWVSHFKSWRQGLTKKFDAGQDISVDLLTGADLVEAASRRATGSDAKSLKEWAAILRSDREPSDRISLALGEELAELMAKYPDKELATTYDKELVVVVDRPKARFSAWYEMFPRSCAPEAGRHGTFKDCEARLSYVASMGFDVLYFPPIHPIGITHRKGKNNTPATGPDDPGSPWAIGSVEGGHKAVHPQLGTVEDFQRLVAKAGEHGLEIAIDLAYQCTPDHPYVKEHPEWFRWRPDRTVQYAENPPKKYEDIYPLNFETEKWKDLWEELKGVVLFWIDHGVSSGSGSSGKSKKSTRR